MPKRLDRRAVTEPETPQVRTDAPLLFVPVFDPKAAGSFPRPLLVPPMVD